MPQAGGCDENTVPDWVYEFWAQLKWKRKELKKKYNKGR